MKIRFCLSILLLLLLGSQIVFSQSEDKYINARKDIIDFRNNSVLLVRLQTRDKSIQAYRDRNMNEYADKLQNEQDLLNKRIIQAFEDYYNFTQVYYFLSSDSRHIINQTYDSISFVNIDLKPDPSIKPNLTSFYVAQFGIVSSETDALGVFIMNSMLEKLQKPFPYYAKSPFFSSKNNTPWKTVKRLNKNLHFYYQQAR